MGLGGASAAVASGQSAFLHPQQQQQIAMMMAERQAFAQSRQPSRTSLGGDSARSGKSKSAPEDDDEDPLESLMASSASAFVKRYACSVLGFQCCLIIPDCVGGDNDSSSMSSLG